MSLGLVTVKTDWELRRNWDGTWQIAKEDSLRPGAEAAGAGLASIELLHNQLKRSDLQRAR